MSKSIKRELLMFSTTDYYGLKEHFEDMAKKGWMLEKIGYLTAKYRRIEPQDLVFSVDIFPSLYNDLSKNKDDIKWYISLCEDRGWKYIGSYDNLQVFYSRKEDNLIPIQTEEKVKQKVREESIFMTMVSTLILIFLMFNSLIKITPFDYTNLFLNITLIYTIFAPIILVSVLIFIFRRVFWIISAKIKIRGNKSLPRTNYDLAKINGVVICISGAIMALASIISIIFDSITTSMPSFWIIISIILSPTVVFIFDYKIKSINTSKFNKAIILFVMLIIVYLPIFILQGKPNDYYNAKELESGYIGFTTEDFHINNTPNTKSFRKEGSILVPKKSVYREYYNDNSLNTIYIKGRNNRIAKYIFDEMLEEGVRYKKVITPADNEYEDFDKAFYLRNPKKDIDHTVILLKDKEIIYFDCSFDLSYKENVEIIINKLNN